MDYTVLTATHECALFLSSLFCHLQVLFGHRPDLTCIFLYGFHFYKCSLLQQGTRLCINDMLKFFGGKNRKSLNASGVQIWSFGPVPVR